MKKNSYFQYLIITTAFLCITSAQSMGQKRGDDLLTSITTQINKLKESAPGPSEIEEVISPAMKKEKNQIIQKIIKDAKLLDLFIATLSSKDQVIWQQKQTALLEPAKTVLKQAVADSISTTWQDQGKAIAQAALGIVLAGVQTAAITLVVQGVKMGTGNLLELDTNALLLSGLSGTAYAAIAALTKSTSIAYASSETLSQAIIAPCLTTNSFTVTMPTAKGPIIGWLMGEAVTLATKIVEESGGISTMMGTVNLNQTLLPSWSKQISGPSNVLVAAALPKVQTIIKNQKIASVLTEVGWIVMQSATIGGIVYMAGFGYADSSMMGSVSYSVLTGAAQGALAAVATLGGKVSPGSLLTIASAPLAQHALSIAGGTPHAAATAVIQATITEVSNILMEETKKYGGLLPSLQKGKETLGQAVRSRWGNTWSALSSGWSTMINSMTEALTTIQEIEPLAI